MFNSGAFPAPKCPPASPATLPPGNSSYQAAAPPVRAQGGRDVHGPPGPLPRVTPGTPFRYRAGGKPPGGAEPSKGRASPPACRGCRTRFNAFTSRVPACVRPRRSLPARSGLSSPPGTAVRRLVWPPDSAPGWQRPPDPVLQDGLSGAPGALLSPGCRACLCMGCTRGQVLIFTRPEIIGSKHID